jgi:signal peptidase I
MTLKSSKNRTLVRFFGLWKFAVAGVFLAVILRLVFFANYEVTSSSMSPTISTGDHILINQISRFFAPNRGDIVVVDGIDSFTNIHEEFVKRVIAVEGDHIKCCTAKGKLILNGKTLTEPYLHGEVASETQFDVRVPMGRIWLMGDNRKHSSDSRDLLGMPGGGTIATDKILGQVLAIYWPTARMGQVD